MSSDLHNIEPMALPETLAVERIESKRAASLVVEHHYLHRKPPISHAYGLFNHGLLVGAVTYGTPASRHLQKSACPSEPSNVIELNRLWVSDAMPKNTESWFVSRTLKELPPKIVVSYADTREQHYGYIYRALNFRYAGWTDMDRKTPRYDYIPHDPKAHTRDAFRTGYAYKVRRLPKVRYWTVTGSKRDRKALARMSGWPTLDWKTLPPPEYVEAVQAWSATCDAGNAGPGYENAWRAALDAAAPTLKADAYELGWQRAVNAHPSWWQDPEYSKNPYRG